ncbi:MAG: hypothetical protein HYZ42_14600 [Bacteroidetes bacterium]|nr:hypothetical protein [Bacteroidota bacterium]
MLKPHQQMLKRDQQMLQLANWNINEPLQWTIALLNQAYLQCTSSGNHREINRDSTGNQPRINRDSTGNQPRINRESTENEKMIIKWL